MIATHLGQAGDHTFQSRARPTGVFPYAMEKLSILAFLLSEAKAS